MDWFGFKIEYLESYSFYTITHVGMPNKVTELAIINRWKTLPQRDNFLISHRNMYVRFWCEISITFLCFFSKISSSKKMLSNIPPTNMLYIWKLTNWQNFYHQFIFWLSISINHTWLIIIAGPWHVPLHLLTYLWHFYSGIFMSETQSSICYNSQNFDIIFLLFSIWHFFICFIWLK